MKYSPSMIPQFISRLEQAKSEQEVQEACTAVKSAVAERWANESTRRKPMGEIRKAVRERFPEKVTDDEKAQFPCYFTNSGKGRVNRWEHLAIKHLSEKEYNPQTDWSDVAVKVEAASTPPEVVKPDIDILNEVGLSSDEVEAVKVAAKGADIREWVKLAIIQRANAINRKNAFLDEDLTEISSKTLMEEKKYRSSPIASRELVSRAVRVVKQWNHDYPDQKWCITNKVLSELSGVTVKAVAKTVEGMDLESYNQAHGLEPLGNRSLKAAVGNPSDVMSLDRVTGMEGTEVEYTLHAVVESTPTKTVESKKKIKQLPANGTSTIDIQDFLKSNPGYLVSLKGEKGSLTYERMNDERGVYIGMKCLETGEETKEI